MRRFDAALRRATPKGHKTFISCTAAHQESRLPRYDSSLRAWHTNAVRLQRLAENDGFGAAGQRGHLLEGVAGVFALAEVINPRYSALVLLGTFGGLR